VDDLVKECDRLDNIPEVPEKRFRGNKCSNSSESFLAPVDETGGRIDNSSPRGSFGLPDSGAGYVDSKHKTPQECVYVNRDEVPQALCLGEISSDEDLPQSNKSCVSV